MDRLILIGLEGPSIEKMVVDVLSYRSVSTKPSYSLPITDDGVLF